MEESKFNFLGYRVSKVECEIKDDFNVQENSFSQSINIEKNYSEDEDTFVEIVLNVTVESEDKGFRFFIRIKGGFLADEDMPQDLFDRLASHNGPAILYPFVRAIIASFTAQANIPPVILPTINFTSVDIESSENIDMKQ